MKTSSSPSLSQHYSSIIAQPLPYVYPWEEMPYEIRDKIFSEVHDEDSAYPHFYWEGKIPALVVALRPLKISYGHVLEWLAKFCSNIHMQPWFGYDLSDWNPIELSLIKILEVEMSDLAGYINDVYKEDTESWEWGFKKPSFFTEVLRGATNLREVYLRIDLDNSVNQCYMAPFITQWPLWLDGCASLSKVQVELPVASWMVTSHARDRNLDGLVRRIAQKVGVHGQFVKQIGDRFHEERELWLWEAPVGRVMNWAQDIGREWHHARSRYSSWEAHNKVDNILDHVHNIRLEERSDGFVLEEDAEDETEKD